jgi:two-component system, OmpR family, KDP operon response regulator KdpE
MNIQGRYVMKEKILALDADPLTRSLLYELLRACGYDVLCVEQREAMLAVIAEQRPHLLLLDDADLCALIRRLWPQLPMMVLSAATDEREKVHALDLGADDYISKPFDCAELLARVRAHLRRASMQAGSPPRAHEPEVLTSHDGSISINRLNRLVHVGHRRVRLTKTAFELLWQLMLHEGRVLTHSMLLHRVWGAAYTQEAGYLHVYIYQLRWKLEEDPAHPRYILTTTGIGYKFQSPEEDPDQSSTWKETQQEQEDQRQEDSHQSNLWKETQQEQEDQRYELYL